MADDMDYVTCFIFADDAGDEEVWQGYTPTVPRVGDVVSFDDATEATVKRIVWYPRANRRLQVGVFVKREE